MNKDERLHKQWGVMFTHACNVMQDGVNAWRPDAEGKRKELTELELFDAAYERFKAIQNVECRELEILEALNTDTGVIRFEVVDKRDGYSSHGMYDTEAEARALIDELNNETSA